jgi:hypothetical protein
VLSMAVSTGASLLALAGVVRDGGTHQPGGSRHHAGPEIRPLRVDVAVDRPS